MDLQRIVNGEYRRFGLDNHLLTSLSVEPIAAIDSAEDTADTFCSKGVSVEIIHRVCTYLIIIHTGRAANLLGVFQLESKESK